MAGKTRDSNNNTAIPLTFNLCIRHNSFRRHLPRQMNVSSFDFSMDAMPLRQSSTASIGRIKPELYKQKSVDAEDEAGEPVESCGKLSFSLRYDYEEQALVVRILKALDLPAKDFTGTSDPYVKIYLLPERKKKFQTRVHRKNLNPTFDEAFCFPVVYDELCNRKLHFSVYDFDRFTSHDMIGEVVVDNLFELSDLSREAVVWKDIHTATTVSPLPPYRAVTLRSKDFGFHPCGRMVTFPRALKRNLL